MSARYYKKPGFTLIELLVVISIIALLISILLPALASARGAVRASKCLVNIKSQAMAIHLYASDYKDYAPPYYIRRASGTWEGPAGYPSWADAFLSDAILLGQYTQNETTETGGQTLYGAFRNGGVWDCPDYPVGVGFNQSRYCLNSRFYVRLDASYKWATMWRVASAKKPSTLMATADSDGAGYHTGYGNEFYTITDELADTSGTFSIGTPTYRNNLRKRHHGRTTVNISFIDGHAANFKTPREDYLAGRIDTQSPE
ncbi:MAG TPA: hypothetical protein DCM28_13650 [Phycisphaerales bacterium]|nr:hypothetical protein [Phycisphaerales bacterium]|tara:strand:+ start:4822 stop:5595 length:774 start_codon:yes stop_codon:yes gene_type:complete